MGAFGDLGPLIRAEVGDTIRIVFRNNATRPYSMHPHGVFYRKDSEGLAYLDGTTGADRLDDAVAPHGTHIYVGAFPNARGPRPATEARSSGPITPTSMKGAM